MKKKFMLWIVVCLLLLFTACQKGGQSGRSDPAHVLSLTPAEEEANYRLIEQFGFKFKLPEIFIEGKDHISTHFVGDAQNPVVPCYGGEVYGFVSDEQRKLYVEITEDSELSLKDKEKRIEEEVLSKTKEMFGFFVFRTELIKGAKLESLTGFPNNRIISEKADYLHVFSVNEASETGLEEDAKLLYQDMMSAVPELEKTVTAGTPETLESALRRNRPLRFKADSVQGDEVDDTLLSKSEYTMFVVWESWDDQFSTPVIRELSSIQPQLEEMKVRLVGIVADADPKEGEISQQKLLMVETLVKDLLKELDVDFLQLEKSESIKDAVTKYISSIPVVFVIDAKGDLCGEIIVGRRSAGEYLDFLRALPKK